jgi:hypothetical protein
MVQMFRLQRDVHPLNDNHRNVMLLQQMIRGGVIMYAGLEYW